VLVGVLGLIFRGKDHRQVYLIGNPAVWWPATFAVAAYLLVKGISILRWQRGFKDYNNRNPGLLVILLIISYLETL